VPVPGVPTLGGGGSGQGQSWFSRKKQQKVLTPTLRAITFKLKGKTTKGSVLSGLGERYVAR
jgi:hypothetical protein